MKDAPYRDIAFEIVGQVARISHNRPERRNAEGTLLLDELDDALSRCADDDNIRVVIVGGKGEHFSAGHDVKEAMSRPDQVESRYVYEERRYLGYCLRLWDFPKPTIAQVQGACIAGGFMLANMCDLVVASEDAFFVDPTCATLAAAATEVLIHPWVLGLRAAKEFLYTGRKMFADEALRLGMVNRIFPSGSLEEGALALANEVAKAPPFAIRMLKRSLNRTADMQGFRNAIQAHFDTHELCHTTQEYKNIRAGGLDKTIARTKASAG
ncbi:enoyl-CoA hydratase [Paraburkholderia elongata]|uniref:enoyl-CoA hydratase n=1 Tax=Paraburkholderia elongata TaxID=2675747 RepID=UPI0038B270F0